MADAVATTRPARKRAPAKAPAAKAAPAKALPPAVEEDDTAVM